VRLAARRPEVVRRLVLVAPAGVPAGRSMFGYLGPLLSAAWYATPTYLPVLVYDALRMGPVTLWRAARDLLAEDVRADLKWIEAQTLLIWGENDTLVPSALGGVLREEIPDSPLLVLNGAAHVPMFDLPVAFLGGELVGD
jgi:pimeloyl-ACP methyl ester carboxylesterase